VSVITPTFDRHEILADNLLATIKQKYPNFEIVVADSGNIPADFVVKKIRENTKIPIKYIRFENKGEYTLAKARNLAVMEAEGEFLLFCDERIAMLPGAIEAFINGYTKKVWLWGMKDEIEKGFVENFSFIKRGDLIKKGMFCERIDEYGGMGEELRRRFEPDIMFEFIHQAKAKSIAKAGAKYRKREHIINAKFKVFKLHGK